MKVSHNCEVVCDAPAAPASDSKGPSVQPDGADTKLFVYWFLLRSRWRLITIITCFAFAATFVFARFVMHARYRAEAIIRPVPISQELSALEGGVSANATGMSVFENLAGGFSRGEEKAQEYMSILRSYDFTIALLDRYQLARDIARLHGWSDLGGARSPSKWTLYRMMHERFDCQYNIITGNIKLYFIDRHPAQATRILGLYIESLREKLRREQVVSSRAAVVALDGAAQGAADTLLQEQLYRLMARQVQREKLAQVEADFAFMEVEGPVVPEEPYSPHPLADGLVMGILVMVLACLWLIASDSLRRSYAVYRRAAQGTQRTKTEAAEFPRTNQV